VPAEVIQRKIGEVLQAPGLLTEWLPPQGLDRAIGRFAANPSSYQFQKELHERYAELVEGLAACLWECDTACQEWHAALEQARQPTIDGQQATQLREIATATVYAVEAIGSILESLDPVLARSPSELNWCMPETPDLTQLIYAIRGIAPKEPPLANPEWVDVSETAELVGQSQ
jgi:hypothetical protein